MILMTNLRRFLFGYVYFSRDAYEARKKQIALDAAGRPSRGNISAQMGQITTEADLVSSARVPLADSP